MTDTWQEAAAVQELAHVLARLERISIMLDAMPEWEPSKALRQQGRELGDELDAIAGRWSQKLVVALVGPSGAGKSTLFNRLAGADVSTTGLTRPTTRQVVACARDEEDASWLAALLGEGAVRITVSESMPEGMILLDTPDTNTLPENRARLTAMLDHIDVMLPVFAALNPKLADNIAYLASFVARMPADAVTPVLTMVDRVPRHDLMDDVVPDWRCSLEREWGLADAPQAYLVNGRGSGLGNGTPDEEPLHDIDQFADLVDALSAGASQVGSAAHRRMALAESMLARYERSVAEAIETSASARQDVAARLDGLVSDTVETVRRELQREGRRSSSELAGALYGAMSPRLWGPVGWVMLLWTLGVRLVQALSRLGRGSSLATWRDQAQPPATTRWSERVAERVGVALDRALAGCWPPIGDTLARAGFSALRPQPSLDASQTELAEMCQLEADDAIERLARRLTHGLVQLMFNLPLLALAGWVSWDAVYGLVSRQFLQAGYLDQALVALAVLWAIALALYQATCVLSLRRTVRRRLTRRVVSCAVNLLVSGHRASLEQVDGLAGVLNHS